MADAPINHAQQERAALCDLFVAVGPDAPTLNEGWNTRDLAAHLVVRERRPDAALGLLASPLAKHGEKVRLEYAKRSWAELVQLVRSGPPRTSVMRLGAVDRAANTSEYFIHHEDVRRGAGDLTARELDPGLVAQLWNISSRTAKFALRKAPCGVVVVASSGERVVGNKSEPSVELHGDVGELVLFLSGRQRAAHVEVIGTEVLATAIRTAPLGI